MLVKCSKGHVFEAPKVVVVIKPIVCWACVVGAK